MNRLSVFKEDDPKEAVFHFRYLDPPTDATISLHALPNWVPDGALDPVVLNSRAIGPGPNKPEVVCELHMIKVSECDGVSRCGITSQLSG